ncbi:MAG: sodium:calcium symporter [Syntrophomonadaceae bacterium]|nr:sodium:calcium symporter [Syntrophomonadaceae bacterium]
MNKRIIGAITGLAIALVMSAIEPLPGLTPQAMLGLGIFFCAVVFWICEVFPDYVTALLMCGAWAGTGIVPFKIAFAQFSSDTWFLLVAAFGLGAAVARSGLLNRVSLKVMELFPATFKGQTAALVAAGNLIGPLIPSVTAKCAMAAPFAKGISDKMGYERDSRGAAGLFGAMFLGFGISGPAFLSASFMCYTIKGLLPPEVQAQLTWTAWAVNALPWTLVVAFLGYFALQLLYKPEQDVRVDKQYIKQQLAELGPMSRNEKIVSIVLLACLLLWMTERMHGVSAAIVALVGLCILLGLDVINRNDFKSGIGWDSIIFIGCIINIGAVFPQLGIDKWIGSVAGPYLVPMVSNIWLYILVGSIAIYLVRFFIVSMIATFTIFTVIVTPFAVSAGVNPFVTAFVILAAVNVFHMFYQNSTYLAGYYAAGDMVSHNKMIKLSVAYMIISIVGLAACVPVWQMTGFLP